MELVALKTRTGAGCLLPRLTEEELSSLLIDRSTGFCIRCGSQHDSIEPDACKYQCEDCGEFSVYGCEEMLIRGWLIGPIEHSAAARADVPEQEGSET